MYYVYEFDPETGDPIGADPVDEYTNLGEAKRDAQRCSVHHDAEVVVVSFREPDEDVREIVRYKHGEEV